MRLAVSPHHVAPGNRGVEYVRMWVLRVSVACWFGEVSLR